MKAVLYCKLFKNSCYILFILLYTHLSCCILFILLHFILLHTFYPATYFLSCYILFILLHTFYPATYFLFYPVTYFLSCYIHFIYLRSFKKNMRIKKGIHCTEQKCTVTFRSWAFRNTFRTRKKSADIVEEFLKIPICNIRINHKCEQSLGNPNISFNVLFLKG
jgi:hypothetical protein